MTPGTRFWPPKWSKDSGDVMAMSCDSGTGPGTAPGLAVCVPREHRCRGSGTSRAQSPGAPGGAGDPGRARQVV